MDSSPSPLSYAFHRVLLPLACGSLGGVLALQFAQPAASPAPAPDSCKDLAAQVATLQSLVLRSHAAQVAAPVGAPVPSAPPPAAEVPAADVKQVAEGFLADAKRMREQLEASRAEREVRQVERMKEQSEVELVKLRNLQTTLSLDQTKANVVRRLKQLALPEAELTKLGELGAPYIRQRSDAMIKILEQSSSGTRPTPAEIERLLRPLDDGLAAALPTTLDDVTRRAIATELRTMVDVPYFLRR